ncbi:hypothetical protein [Oryzibacter oryziterrae]|uniref:hypothetical protein n=1 Tax=Oryzibacter oryziterrae TaxID=2766474 RepID=UPI001F42DBCC|nr:hypothetical protein [Oryzibacter oryziterrae]
MAEGGELNATIGTGQVRHDVAPVRSQRDRPSLHGCPEGFATGQIADIDKSVDETVTNTIFSRTGNSSKGRRLKRGNLPSGDSRANAQMLLTESAQRVHFPVHKNIFVVFSALTRQRFIALRLVRRNMSRIFGDCQSGFCGAAASIRLLNKNIFSVIAHCHFER